jgi:hypothetical protein
MTSRSGFTPDEARAAGERIGIDWGSAPFDLEQFRMGMDVELEHGARDPQTNVTDDDIIMTAKIARRRTGTPKASERRHRGFGDPEPSAALVDGHSGLCWRVLGWACGG